MPLLGQRVNDVTTSSIRTKILSFANSREIDSAQFMLALADTIATVAVVLDLDPLSPKVSLNDRIDSLVDHIRTRHPEIMQEMLARRAMKS